MTEQKIALVSGANKGIGYEIAAGLGRLGFTVGVGARDEERRNAAVDGLREQGVDAFAVPLDVTDDASVTAAAALIDQTYGHLDVLVNNAAITGGWNQKPTDADPEIIRAVVETNVIGVIRMINATLPLLERSASPRIVNISSSVGSLTYQSDRSRETGPVSIAYAPSKTYLNAVTLAYVRELAGSKILINNGCPGFVSTDLNGHRGTRTPEQGAQIAIKLATLPDDGPTGTYSNDDGIIPW